MSEGVPDSGKEAGLTELCQEVSTVAKGSTDILVQQTEALTTLAEGVKAIAGFLQGGGLAQILSGYARSQAVKDILGGLATHDGRNALDARVLQQNATEIVAQVEAVFAKYQEKLEEGAAGEERDPEVKDSENAFKIWLDEKRKSEGEA